MTSRRGNWLDAPASRSTASATTETATAPDFTLPRDDGRASDTGAGGEAVAVGGGLDVDAIDAQLAGARRSSRADLSPQQLFAEIDSRTSPGYTRRGGLYRVEWSDYRQINAGEPRASAASTPKCSSSCRCCARTG